MATALKLRTDIKKLKAAIANKGIKKEFIPKLKAQLEKAENELASLKKGGKPRNVSTTKGSKSLLDRAKALVKKNPKYSGYKSSGVDLKKDAEEGALPIGRRISKGLKANQVSGKGNAKQNKGNVYYEYRMNRLDVKQPKAKQSYPKLEDGGMMAKGGIVLLESVGTYFRTKDLATSPSKNFDDIFHLDEITNYEWWYSLSNEDKKTLEKYFDVNKYLKKEFGTTNLEEYDEESEDFFKKLANRGMMAKGGETKKAKWIETVNAKDVEDDEGYWENYEYATSKELMPSEGRYKGYRWVLTTNSAEPEGFWEKIEGGKYPKYGYMAKGGKTKDEPMVIRGFSDDEAYEYAKGGRLEDNIIFEAAEDENARVKFHNDTQFAFYRGARWMERYLGGNKMAHGGELGAVNSKTHRYDK
jgi:hypothetical protein